MVCNMEDFLTGWQFHVTINCITIQFKHTYVYRTTRTVCEHVLVSEELNIFSTVWSVFGDVF